MRFKAIGILGGLGPLATATFYQRLLAHSRQHYGSIRHTEYPQIIINSINTLASGESDSGHIREQLNQAAKTLIAAGAQVLAIPCNSAHVFIDKHFPGHTVDFVSLPIAVAQAVTDAGVSKPLLLGTGITHRSGLYSRLMTHAVSPGPKLHAAVLQAIDELKIGEGIPSASGIVRAIRKLHSEGKIDGVILGRTELSLWPWQTHFPFPALDTLDILVQATLLRSEKTA